MGRGPGRGESLRKHASSPQPSPPSCARRRGRKASKIGRFQTCVDTNASGPARTLDSNLIDWPGRRPALRPQDAILRYDDGRVQQSETRRCAARGLFVVFYLAGMALSSAPMSAAYRQLLDATIAHLERLQGRGVGFVPASPEALAALVRPVPAAGARPAPVVPRARLQPVVTSERWQPVAPPVEVPRLPVAVLPLAARPALGAEEKAAAFADLRQRTLACVRCANLVRSRQKVVFGVGNPDTELMFVGEAPGADEDQQGEPFVGAAGQLLTKIIQAMGYQRGEVYIANILKCRPDTPGQSAGNRKPTPAEMATCIPWLHEQIDLIRPRVLVALGGTAVEGLLGGPVFIMKLRGNWREYRGIPLMPTYHPAFLLRNQSLIEKRKLWEDMLQVLAKLGRPVSEKQRNYFLKA